MQAAAELDEEFPGAGYDDSLLEFMVRKCKKNKIIKKIIKKIIFHSIFYSLFTAGILFLFKQYNIGLLSGMIFGSIYFLIYILYKLKILNQN